MVRSRLDGDTGYVALAGDLLVILNLVVLTVEAEYGQQRPALLHTFRHVFCGLFLLEIGVRLWREGAAFLARAFNYLEVLVIGIGIVDTWFLPKATWLWTITSLRAFRFLRFGWLANGSDLFKDLWLVVVGLSQSVRSFVWVGLVLAVVSFAWGGTASGLINAAPEWQPGDPVDCYHSFSRSTSDCVGLDTGEYFGGIGKSMLTMMQLFTLDQWASHIVRPIADSQPFVAVVLFTVVVFTSYGLLSIALGVMVCNTVELARTHKTHWSMMAMTEDLEIIDGLQKYFRATLQLEERTVMDKRSLVDAMPVPQVAEAFRQLQLPVSGIDELFSYLDKGRRGTITVDEFARGIQNLKQPANRFDVACVTAQVGGQVTMVHRLEKRANASLDKLMDVGERLRLAFGALSELAEPGGGMSQVPEVQLRKMGCIQTVPPTASRYTF